jgi:hypothetical protein
VQQVAVEQALVRVQELVQRQGLARARARARALVLVLVLVLVLEQHEELLVQGLEPVQEQRQWHHRNRQQR